MFGWGYVQDSVATERSVGLSLGLEPVNQVLVSREPSAGLAVPLGCPSPPLLHLPGWSHGTADQLGLQPGQSRLPLCAKIFLPAPRQQGLCPHCLTWLQLQVMWCGGHLVSLQFHLPLAVVVVWGFQWCLESNRRKPGELFQCCKTEHVGSSLCANHSRGGRSVKLH